jgi:hypothetical protein
MPIFDLFSKRQKRLRGEVPDVYVYDEIPQHFRVQIIHIIKDVVGKDNYGYEWASNSYKFIHETLCREYGVFQLKEYANSDYEAIYDYFLKCDDHERVIDIIEVSFKCIDIYTRKNEYRWNTKTKISTDEAIKELNGRFKEHGIGYQFESNEIIRVDSNFLHSETVKPVLQLLRSGKLFKGANDEFLKAHEHYRHTRHKECLNECLKAFESVMKAICDKRKWKYNQNDTAKKLISVCFDNHLIHSYLQSQFTSLRSLLESGTPTVRNKLSGHGQGTQSTKVPSYVSSYALHLTAANILFLAECDKNLK